jgi:hypothetical protein
MPVAERKALLIELLKEDRKKSWRGGPIFWHMPPLALLEG